MFIATEDSSKYSRPIKSTVRSTNQWKEICEVAKIPEDWIMSDSEERDFPSKENFKRW
jgi:hypothetical protein